MNAPGDTEKSTRERNQDLESHRGATMYLILIILSLFLLFGSLPVYPHSRRWGYYPSGRLGLVLLIVLVLIVFGQV